MPKHHAIKTLGIIQVKFHIFLFNPGAKAGVLNSWAANVFCAALVHFL